MIDGIYVYKGDISNSILNALDINIDQFAADGNDFDEGRDVLSIKAIFDGKTNAGTVHD